MLGNVGVYLVVDASGARRWLLRTVVQGRRRDIGLGSARLVPLADARDTAAKMRRVAREGGDPLAERRRARTVVPTFKGGGREGSRRDGSELEEQEARGVMDKLRLESYAFPVLGSRRVDQIATADVLKVLSPIWLTKAETARRIRQRVRSALDWARLAYTLPGGDPVEGVERALPKQPERGEHYAAMPYAEVPALVATLRRGSTRDVTVVAFEFLVLTASRTSEVLLARWDEVDFDEKIWRIPAARMKMGEAHCVPLCDRALALLNEAERMAGMSR